MIASQDRSKRFGASDTAMIMGNWGTKTFAKWWLSKLGAIQNNYTTLAMRAGTAYEHKILDAIGVKKRDRQVKKRSLRLRVNLDGEIKGMVYEVKTYGKGAFKVTKAYWQQCQVEMYATSKECVIVAYKLLEDDYTNFFNDIDPKRISYHPIEYDREWVNTQYLPRIKYLCECLRERRTPDADRF